MRKNSAIKHVSFGLGLRAQEIWLLRVQEIEQRTDTHGSFALRQVMTLPARFTEDANATKQSNAEYLGKTISIPIESFDKVILDVAKLAKSGEEVDPEDFYPSVKNRKGGKSQEIPIVHKGLRRALERCIEMRLLIPLQGLAWQTGMKHRSSRKE